MFASTLIHRFSWIASVAVICFSFVTAAQANTKTIEAIEISGLGNYRGQYLSIYYGIGSRPTINRGTAYYDISKVLVKRTFAITSDSVTSDSVVLSLVGFTPRRPNFIGFVIHPDPEVTYLNADSSIPENENPNNSRRISRQDSLLLTELEVIIKAQTVDNVKPAVVKYQLR